MKYAIKMIWLVALLSFMLTATHTYAGTRDAKSYKKTVEITYEDTGRKIKTTTTRSSWSGNVVEVETIRYPLPTEDQSLLSTSSEANSSNVCLVPVCQPPASDSQQQVIDQVVNQPSLTTDIINQLPID